MTLTTSTIYTKVELDDLREGPATLLPDELTPDVIKVQWDEFDDSLAMCTFFYSSKLIKVWCINTDEGKLVSGPSFINVQ